MKTFNKGENCFQASVATAVLTFMAVIVKLSHLTRPRNGN